MSGIVKFYLALFMRRIHWFLLIVAVFAAVSLTVAKILPPLYAVTTRLLMEPPQIPTQLAASTVQTTAVEELAIIQQQLMTRVNLLDIAKSEGVYADVDNMSPDDVVSRMNGNTTIRQVSGRNAANLLVVTFESRDPEIAAAVVNRYVTLILRDNAAMRAGRAGNTLEFFQVEVERLSKELADQSARILAFNNDNSDALPSTLNFRLNQQSALQSRLTIIDRDTATLKDQRQRLVDIFQATGSVAQASTLPQTPEQQKLAQLEQQLSSALAIYSPEHPRIKVLQSQVAQQTEIVREQAAMSGAQPGQAGASLLDVQLADIDSRIKALDDEKIVTEEELAKLNDSIDRTPSVQIELDGLNRDYSNIQQQYNRAVNGLAQAATGERIEALSRGQRITVIDPPVVPNTPTSPNRPLIAAGGTALGILVALGLFALLEIFNKAIRRPVDIAGGLGITPLTTIPYIRSPMEQVARRAIYSGVFLGLVIGLPVILYLVHTYYLPLDAIYDQIAGRVGAILG